MSGIANAAEVSDELMRGHYADICRGQKQSLYLPRFLIILVHNDLTAVYVGLVLYLNSVLVDVVVPFERLFKRREQTHGVDILAGGELHSRDNEQAVLLTHLHSRLAVERDVMVGQSNNVKSEQLRHSHDIIRRHIHIAAGRQTGMKV